MEEAVNGVATRVAAVEEAVVALGEALTRMTTAREHEGRTLHHISQAVSSILFLLIVWMVAPLLPRLWP